MKGVCNLYRPKMTGLTKLIWTLLIISFGFMVFPGVLFFHNVAEPFMFGMPFIYGYILCWWAFQCAVLLFAHKVNWGKKKEGDK